MGILIMPPLPFSAGTPHPPSPVPLCPLFLSLFLSLQSGRVLCGHTLPGVRLTVAAFPALQAPVAGCRPDHKHVRKRAAHARNAGIPSGLHVRTGDSKACTSRSGPLWQAAHCPLSSLRTLPFKWISLPSVVRYSERTGNPKRQEMTRNCSPARRLDHNGGNIGETSKPAWWGRNYVDNVEAACAFKCVSPRRRAFGESA